MEPTQAADTTRIIVTSFGVGIGIVTVPLFLNLISNTFERLKRRRRGSLLPPLEEYDRLQLMQVQRSVRQTPDTMPTMPTVRFR
ncbi:MAG: hypothetical protein ACUVX8_12640 [Candidatus Zipacnadales bacterium]